MNVPRLARLYRAVLRLYPHSFRTEFADEMQAVFTEAVDEAVRRDLLALGEVCLNELRDLPASLLSAHAQARRSLRAAAARLPKQLTPELSWKQLIVTLGVFLLPGIVILAMQGEGRASPAGLLFLVVMGVVASLRGLRFWSLPYMGTAIAIAAYLFLFQWIADLVSPSLIANIQPGPWDHSTYLLLKVISTGMLWLMLFCLTLLITALLALYNRFQPLCWRIRHDWSLLSFILYGETLFGLVLLFDRYRYEWRFTLAGLLCLTAGVWFYMHAARKRLRSLALLGGLVLATALTAWGAAGGRWLALPGGQIPLSVFTVQSGWLEIGRAALAWSWMLAALLLPGWWGKLAGRFGARFSAGGSDPPRQSA